MKFCCFFLLLILTGCDQFYDREYPHHIYAHNVRENFILEQQRADKNIEVYSTGGGMREHVERMSAGFTYRKIISLEELRVLFVKYNEWFRYRVNTLLKEYLESYPAPIHEFQVKVSVEDSCGKKPPPGLPCFAVLVKGELRYCSLNSDPNALRFDVLYLEPYEEALEIVRREHPEVLPPDYLLPEEEARAISSAKEDTWGSGVVMFPVRRQ